MSERHMCDENLFNSLYFSSFVRVPLKSDRLISIFSQDFFTKHILHHGINVNALLFSFLKRLRMNNIVDKYEIIDEYAMNMQCIIFQCNTTEPLSIKYKEN